MRTAIIYHQIKPGVNCPDGIAGAWVCKRKYPDADLIGASHGNAAPDVSSYERILIVDFSFQKSLLKEWANKSELLASIITKQRWSSFKTSAMQSLI